MGKVELDEDLTALFDYEAKYIGQDGKIHALDGAGATDYISVVPGDVFVWTGSIDINNAYAVVEYDASKKMIGGSALATQGYRKTRVPYTVKQGAFVRFCTLERKKSALFKTKSFDGIASLVDKTTEYTADAVEALISYDGNSALDYAGAKATGYIPTIPGEKFIVSGYARWQSCCCVFYDSSKTNIFATLYNSDNSEYVAEREIVTAPEGAAYVRFSTLIEDKYPLSVQKYEMLNLRHTDYRLYEFIQELQKSNVLWGKKYVACGDSFTEGPFSTKNDETWDEATQTYKTYCWHIANRNGMTLVNEAQSGSDFTNIEGAVNPFSVDRYLAVPTDADYITLMFGLNETSLTTEQIGTKDDTTNATMWGAYNIVFTHFLTNMPFAKIGVIISDAWMPESYANVMKEICTYWGIPYLDLKGDNIPMGIGGKRSSTSAVAKSLRNAAFQVSDSDSHPNPKAHVYRSTIVENFLRSL